MMPSTLHDALGFALMGLALPAIGAAILAGAVWALPAWMAGYIVLLITAPTTCKGNCNGNR